MESADRAGYREAAPGRTFGELLASHRAAAGLTQEELADRAGLSTAAVGLLERGSRTSPRPSTVSQLAQALVLTAEQRTVFALAARRRPAEAEAALRVPPDLSPPSTPLIGRQADVAAVRALLGRPDVRLVTLTGGPGSGKTRLALAAAAQVAARFADGAVVVSLAPLASAELVPAAIRQALGLREVASEPPLDTVATHCRTRHLLLVLDTFEHVADVAPELARLLARCPRLHALVTSRAALRVRPEHELLVPPLDVPGAGPVAAGGGAALEDVPSVRLFLDRVGALAPGFRLDAGNAHAVAAICRRLGGLPLALELAAPWVRLLGTDGLLARLDRQLDVLVDGPRDLPERQRTMRATLRWSCEVLEPGSQAVLRRLSVFAGSAALDALEHVCEAPGRLDGGVLRQLALLDGHCLVRHVPAGGAEARVVVLDSVREYARELLEAAGELEATASAHLGHLAGLAAAFRRQMRGPAQGAWLDRMRREHDNVRAALDWAAERGPVTTGLRLAADLYLFWYVAGHRREGLDRLERLLAAGGDAPPAVRAEALHAAGALAWRIGETALSIRRQREAVATFRDLGDRRGVAQAQRVLAIALESGGDHAEALRLFADTVDLLRELGDRELLATALMGLGTTLARHGDAAPAARLYEEALAIYREAGDAQSIALCLVNLGNRARTAGDLDLATARYEEAADIAGRLDSRYHLAVAGVGMGEVARTRGEVEAAQARYRESLRLFTGLDEREGAGTCLRLLGWVAWTEGRHATAARLYGAGHALWPRAADADEDDRVLHVEAQAGLRRALGDDAFMALQKTGGRLPREEALAEALGSA